MRVPDWVVEAMRNRFDAVLVCRGVIPGIDPLIEREAMSAALAVAEAAIRADEQEACAKIALQGHCTASGCDPQTTGHSDLCPIGIAAAIRARCNE